MNRNSYTSRLDGTSRYVAGDSLEHKKMAAICAKFCVNYDHYVKRRDIEYFREVGEILKPLSNHYWLKECGHFVEYDNKSIVQIPHDARSKISTHTESLRNGNKRKFFLILDDYGGGHEPEFYETDLVYVGNYCRYYNIKEEDKNRQATGELIDVLVNSELKRFADNNNVLNSVRKNLSKNTISLRASYSTHDFDFAVLRIIAGGALVYCDPHRFNIENIQSGIFKPALPNKPLQKSAQKFLEKAKTQGLTIGTEEELSRISHGAIPNKDSPQLQPVTLSLKRRVLIREVSSLSKRYFDIQNKGKNRVPLKVVENILFMLKDNSADARVLKRYLKTWDDQPPLPFSDHPHASIF